MKRYALVLSLALVLVPLFAGLAWPQAIQVREFKNIEYTGRSIFTHDGCHFITWKENSDGRLEHFFQLYDDQYNPLWPENLHIHLPHSFYEMVETSDAGFVILFQDNGIRAIKISREGDFLWGTEGTQICQGGNFWSMVADLNGGVYIAWTGTSFMERPATLQHLSSDGSISMAAGGVSLDTLYAYRTALLIRPDNSVVVAWAVDYGVRVNMVNSSGDLLWDQTMVIPSTNNYPRVGLCAFDDDTFAFCFVDGAGVFMYRLNSFGEELWQEPVCAISEISTSYSMKFKLTSDNSILTFVYGHGGRYLQKIGEDGSVQLPSSIRFEEWLGYIDTENYSDIIPLEEGACAMVFSSTLEYPYPKDINLVKIDSSGAVSVHPLTDTSNREVTCSAHHGDGGIHVLWQHWADEECGIYAQILDFDLNPTLALNGFPLLVGSSGGIQDAHIAATETGCAVAWEESIGSSNLYQYHLQYYNNQGQPLYGPQGLRINRPGTRLSGYQRLLSNGTDLLLLWCELTDGTYSTRMQIVNGEGELLLADGGIELNSSSQGVESIRPSRHQGDWYLLWESENNVIGQKIRGTQFLWGDGRQLTQAHPDYPGNVNSFSLVMPWLFWNTNTQKFFKHIDTEGITLPGFPEYGKLLNLYIEPPGYPYQEGITKLTVCGDHLHLYKSYNDYSWPHESFTVYYHTFIGPDGEMLFDPVEVEGSAMISYKNNYLWMTGTYWMVEYKIRKYDIFGNELLHQTIPIGGIPSFGQGSWDYVLSNDEHLVFGQGSLLHHFYISAEGELTVPADNIICEDYELPRLSFLDDRLWVLWENRITTGVNTTGIKLQSLVRDPLPNPDEELPSPDMPRFIGCSPNPFNPRVYISFSIPSQGKTKLGVYDLRGRKIRVLIDEDLPATEHWVSWDGKDDAGRDSASGVYFLKLENGGLSSKRKITLLK